MNNSVSNSYIPQTHNHTHKDNQFERKAHQRVFILLSKVTKRNHNKHKKYMMKKEKRIKKTHCG